MSKDPFHKIAFELFGDGDGDGGGGGVSGGGAAWFAKLRLPRGKLFVDHKMKSPTNSPKRAA